ncbi:hypothetical protein EDF83_3709 [Pseudomonas protegens]|jgi:hypothetical protein|nr:hypothetical protein H78_05858 [Pseudomonas protegens]MCS4262662.1 hypothetical protein [Pseudomonas sp. BIGb0176]MDT3423193.1 hypothetical protein [Pseudomonas protegens]ROQ55037.1 hypothetical protein EDF83_3709 [Pseudomonas protegens]ROQ76303.1 hypothetical protein EC837_5348 [Pseudomonas protegens]
MSIFECISIARRQGLLMNMLGELSVHTRQWGERIANNLE